MVIGACEHWILNTDVARLLSTCLLWLCRDISRSSTTSVQWGSSFSVAELFLLLFLWVERP